MKHLFCINPASGKYDHTRQYTEAIRAAATGLDFEIFVSGAPGEITAHVAEQARTGQELRVYACGGDGTLNEAVNGAALCGNAAVTHWPGGSGNDFIRIFSHPERFSDLSELLDAETAQFDLIRVNDRWCIGVASIGIDARIGTEIARYKRLPLVTGSGAYVISTLVNVIKGVYQHYTVTIDNRVFDAGQTMVCLCNGRWYGGGFNPVPEAMPDDGLLDVLLVRPVSRLKIAQVIGKYKNGQYTLLPELISHYRCREVIVNCDRENAINLDGELLRDKTARFSLQPGAIRFFYPRGETWDAPKQIGPAGQRSSQSGRKC